MTGARVDELRSEAARAGRRLQSLTMAWNSAECGVALAAGFVAGSVALVGFGFDSALEVTASLTALWRDAVGALARGEAPATRPSGSSSPPCR